MVGRGSTNQGDFTPLGRAFLQAAPPLFNCMRVSAKRVWGVLVCVAGWVCSCVSCRYVRHGWECYVAWV